MSHNGKAPADVASAVEAEPDLGCLVPQAHGGKLWQGRGPNPFRGGGRPKNELRRALQRVSEDAIPVLQDIIDGEVVRKMRVPLSEVLHHARCPVCDGKLKARAAGQGGYIEFEGAMSASISDRIRAIDLALRYGVGTEDHYDEGLVGKLAQATRTVITADQVEAMHNAWVQVIGKHVRGGG